MSTGPEWFEYELNQPRGLEELKSGIPQREQILRNAFTNVDFWDDISLVTKDLKTIVNKLENKFENEDSSRAILLKNPQIQNFLASLISQHRKTREVKCSKNNNQEKSEENSDEEIVESWEDYVLREASPENFEDFLVSDDWIRVLKDEIDNHIDPNGNFYENYKISKTVLQIKLKKCWFNSMRRKYNLDNNIFSNEETIELRNLWNIIVKWVDKAVWNHLKSWWSNFDGKMVDWLNKILPSGENKELIDKIEDQIKNNKDYKYEIKAILKESISKYYNIVLKNNNISLETLNNDKEISLQLKSYLYIYGKTFYPESFEWDNYDDNKLFRVMKAILICDGKLDVLERNEFLEQERIAEKERKERDIQKRQEAAKRNREINSRISSRTRNWTVNNDTKSGHEGEKTWRQLVVESNINLNDFEWKTDLSRFIKSPQAKQQAFLMAWKRFQNNNVIKEAITPAIVRSLFNVTGNSEINSINENARKEFCDNNDSMKLRSEEEKNYIYSILQSFPDEYNDSLKLIASRINKHEWVIDKKIKESALWSVIDDVRKIFDDTAKKLEWNPNFEWFKLSKNPVTREWNNIIVSWTFNWSCVKIRYDLDSGGLFMNSFIHHTHNPEKIVIWNDKPNLQIWQLKSFNEILDEDYSAPDFSLDSSNYVWNQINQSMNQWQNISTNGGSVPTISMQSLNKKREQNKEQIESIKNKYREMLDEDLDIIWELVAENTNRQSAINSAVTKFMRTFNIIPDGQGTRSIEFNDWWDLFDLLEIINNSDSNTLDKFQSFMNEITKISWLNRWNNNLYWPQDNLESNILNEDNQNNNILMLRNSKEDFSTKVRSLEGKLSFESNYKFWFAQIVKEKLIADGTSKPNRKLDEKKMRDFFTDAWLNSPFQ